QYEFYVLSKCPNIELESEWVGPFTFMTLPLPCATPTDLSIDNITVDSASISWMSDGELFDIQWGTSGFQLGYGTVVSGIQTTTYDLTSLNGYTQYQVYVRKDCSVNQSDWVGPFAFTTLMPECVVPTELAVSNITADSATLNWTSDGSLFHIQYGEQGFSLGSGTIIENIQNTTHNLASLNGYTTHEVYVRKDCTINQSEWIGPIEFTTLIPVCVPPTDLTVTNVQAYSATLSWTSTGNLFDIEWGP